MNVLFEIVDSAWPWTMVKKNIDFDLYFSYTLMYSLWISSESPINNVYKKADDCLAKAIGRGLDLIICPNLKIPFKMQHNEYELW